MLVYTMSQETVQFTISSASSYGFSYTGTTNISSPNLVSIPSNLQVRETTYGYRNVGLYVKSVSDLPISIVLIGHTNAPRSTYLALPCTEYHLQEEYVYYGISAESDQSSRLASNGRTCDEIDECSEGLSSCNMQCINTIGSYYCTCFTGFQLMNDNHTCNDINECSVNNGGCEDVCTNTNGSYLCACQENGYTLDSNEVNCTDSNECSINNGGCAHICVNTPGSYHCNCDDGYTLNLDEHNCSDINECLLVDNRCSHGCVNTPGSYHCTCKDGYYLSNDSHTCLACGPGKYLRNGSICEDLALPTNIEATSAENVGSSSGFLYGTIGGVLLIIIIIIAVMAFVIIAIVLIVIKKKKNGQYNVNQEDQERSTYNTSNPIYNNESVTKFMEEQGDLYDYVDSPQTEEKEKL
uniref:EGF-like domain-containing protein n=1 Tax=Amphimedon queenslandica TaxID=400682 RepID=A0A1X7V2X4_AMPQE